MRVSLRVGGRRALLDLDDLGDHISRRIHRRRSWYEQDLLADISSRVQRGVAIDVGAHIGNHTVFLALSGFEVVAFEPNPITREQLERNVKLNELQVQVLAAAAGSKQTYARLESENPSNTGMTRTIEDPLGGVPMVTIDSLNLDPKVIKIDVEGSELDILEGARQTIWRCKPVLYIESEAEDLRRAVEAFLAPLGYSCFGKYAITPTYGYWAQPKAEIRLSVAVMAHPKRKHMVAQLLKELPGATVVWDEKDDRWDTGKRSLLAFDPEATHHLTIQDDAIVCKDFLDGLKLALERNPHCPTSLYLGRQRPHGPHFTKVSKQAQELGANWIIGPELCWGVALCFPTTMIPKMVEAADSLTNVENYDKRLAMYLNKAKIPTWYTFPSLADHRRQAESPSLVPGRTGENRVAHRFLAKSALDIDWRDGRVVFEKRARRELRRSCPICGARDYTCNGKPIPEPVEVGA